MDVFPKPLKVKVLYKNNLQKITGVGEENIIVSEGMNFITLLHMIFTSYPEIPERYPTGTLELEINGHAPTEGEFLKEGSVLRLEDC